MSQKVVRRLLNTSESRTQDEKDRVIEEFQLKLNRLGLNMQQQKEIIEGELVGYKRRVVRQKGVRHRICKDTEKERERKKMTGKSMWYKTRKENKDVQEKGEGKRSEPRKGLKEKRDSRRDSEKRKSRALHPLSRPVRPQDQRRRAGQEAEREGD